MFEEQIEMLIDAIDSYDSIAPYIILLYIPSNDEDMQDFYFAALAALRIPNQDEMDALLKISKRDVGNMIYAAEHLILPKDEALDYLEDLIY